MVLLIVGPRIIKIFLTRVPDLFKPRAVILRPFLDPHQTTHCLKIRVRVD